MTTFEPREKFFELHLDELARVGFLLDDDKVRVHWRKKLADADLLPIAVNDISRLADKRQMARAIADEFPARRFGLISDQDLSAKIREIRNNSGLCSDYTKVYLAIANAIGLQAREVMNSFHAMIEYWDGNLGKWIFLDPTFSVMAKGPGGQYLSFLEVRARILRGETVDWDFFGGRNFRRWSSDDKLFKYAYLEPGRFASFTMTLGNNVLTMDERRTRQPVPLPLAELIDFLRGLRPGYVTLEDEYSHSYTTWLKRLRFGVFVVVFIYLAGLLGYPSLLIADAIHRRGQRRSSLEMGTLER